jgi:phosphatidylethanolamine/phosphatidyl-N-methylethanolamine N-methyltransferase
MSGRDLSLAAMVGDEFRFIRGWVANRRKIGAISPSSRALARLMVEQADPDPEGYALELGPGSGVFTQALIEAGVPPERIIAIEHSEEFCRLLSQRFPTLPVVKGDAFDLEKTLEPYAGIKFSAAISGLPLLSFPREVRVRCIEGVLARLEPGKAFAQFSYGALGPMPSIAGRFTATPSKWVLMNLPPARVWTYRRV